MEGMEQKIFSHLNLATPGMEQVRESVERNDLDSAAAAYLDYYRTRETPVLPWANTEEDPDLAKQTGHFDFLQDPPLGFTWHDRDAVRDKIYTGKGHIAVRAGRGGESPYTVVDLADLLLEHKVFIPYHHADGAVDLGSDWDWEVVPPFEGQRWPLSLCYQYFLKTLAVSYWLTDDEKYIDKLVWIYRHYFDCVDDRSDWMWIPDMQLARNYQQLLPFILSWEDLKPEDLCALLYWLGTTCAEMMGSVDGAPGNQLLFNGIGLLWIGVGMHEFARSPQWRDKGLTRIGAYFAEGAFYPDGSSKENSLGYTVGSSNSGIEALQLVNKNGWSCPPHIQTAMVKRAQFLADMRRPDGLCPETGDGQQTSPNSYLLNMVDLGVDPSLEFVATSGKCGTEPVHKSSYHPWMGTGVMRSDWERDANYLMCDMGPLGDIHAHEAKLAIEVAAYGRTLIADKGVHTYSREERHHRWFRFLGGTRGHNTVTVDGLCQMRLAGEETSLAEPTDNNWHTSTVCDCLSGEYDEGWGPVQYTEPMRTSNLPPPFDGEIDVWVTHRRTVLHVKAAGDDDFGYWLISDRLTSRSERRYEQLFHFIPVESSLDVSNRSIRTTTDGEANIALLGVDREGLELDVAEGWDDGGEGIQGWHVEAGELVPAPCAIFSLKASGASLMETVIWPLRPGDGRVPKVEQLGADGEGWIKVGLPDDEGVDIICCATMSGRHELASGDYHVSFEGSIALVRLAADGTPRTWDTADGGTLSYGGTELN